MSWEIVVNTLVDHPRFLSSTCSSGESTSSILEDCSDQEMICISKTALLCIEFQHDFISESGIMYSHLESELERTNMLEKSRQLISKAREAGVTIIHAPITCNKDFESNGVTYGILHNVNGAKAFQEGEIGSEFHEDFKPHKEDFIVREKHGPDSFYGTDLDEILQRNHIQNIAIIGLLTNCCVESTMRSAYELGYNVYTIVDCCCATTEEGHEIAIEHTFPMFSVPLKHLLFLDSLTNDTSKDPPSSIRATRSRLIFGSAEHVCRDCAFVHLIDFFAGLPMAFNICNLQILLPFVVAIVFEIISMVCLYFLARICSTKAQVSQPYKKQTATEGMKKVITEMLKDLLLSKDDNLYAQSVVVLNFAKKINLIKCILNFTQITLVLANFYTCHFSSTGVLGVFADFMSTVYLWNMQFDKYAFYF